MKSTFFFFSFFLYLLSTGGVYCFSVSGGKCNRVKLKQRERNDSRVSVPHEDFQLLYLLLVWCYRVALVTNNNSATFLDLISVSLCGVKSRKRKRRWPKVTSSSYSAEQEQQILKNNKKNR